MDGGKRTKTRRSAPKRTIRGDDVVGSITWRHVEAVAKELMVYVTYYGDIEHPRNMRVKSLSYKGIELIHCMPGYDEERSFLDRKELKQFLGDAHNICGLLKMVVRDLKETALEKKDCGKFYVLASSLHRYMIVRRHHEITEAVEEDAKEEEELIAQEDVKEAFDCVYSLIMAAYCR